MDKKMTITLQISVIIISIAVAATSIVFITAERAIFWLAFCLGTISAIFSGIMLYFNIKLDGKTAKTEENSSVAVESSVASETEEKKD